MHPVNGSTALLTKILCFLSVGLKVGGEPIDSEAPEQEPAGFSA